MRRDSMAPAVLGPGREAPRSPRAQPPSQQRQASGSACALLLLSTVYWSFTHAQQQAGKRTVGGRRVKLMQQFRWTGDALQDQLVVECVVGWLDRSTAHNPRGFGPETWSNASRQVNSLVWNRFCQSTACPVPSSQASPAADHCSWTLSTRVCAEVRSRSAPSWHLRHPSSLQPCLPRPPRTPGVATNPCCLLLLQEEARGCGLHSVVAPRPDCCRSLLSLV